MSEELQEKCNAILDDDSVLEEDKIERIEYLVSEHRPDLSSSDKERLVLDILWRHHGSGSGGRDKGDVVIERAPAPSVQVSLSGPLPSDPDKLEKLRREDAVSAKTKPADPQWDDNDWGDSIAPQDAMSPFDILRKILGQENSDEDIHHALERKDFDIQATLAELMAPTPELNNDQGEESIVETPEPENETEVVMCKYFVQFGECLRADCKYSHDLSSRICRFWLKGGCLAGDTCPFLHQVPESVVEKYQSQYQPVQQVTEMVKEVKLQDENDFPTLGQQPKGKKRKPAGAWGARPASASRPVNSSPITAKPINVWGVSGGAPGGLTMRKLNRRTVKLVAPKHIPWDDREYGVNGEYVSYRLAAIRHGSMRNKYLQLAAESWHQNKAAHARLLSQKGQKHNDEMIDQYAKAAEVLFTHRQQPDSDIFVDLHGLSLEEAVEKLDKMLRDIEKEEVNSKRPAYVISGQGHYHSHSKASEDKLTQRVREHLTKKGFEWKDISTKDSRFGRITCVDPWSHF
uniref:ARAD1C14564p n=1 Tax=Blastobotrys adeninivorans TaxID=409370 RepID=A0A060T0P0_BLAAD